MNRLKVLITGAASGIGRSTAIRFAAEGHDVCINDIQAAKLDTLVQELAPGSHLVFPGSFSNESDIAKGKELIEKHWGHLNVLVSCAGLSAPSDPIHSTLEEWRKVFDIMVDGCVLISALAAGFMEKSGRIIHISSIHSNHAEKGASSYAMAKSAINQFCRAMAVELADRNILVNAIAPGFVDTPMAVVDGKNELESEWFRRNYIEAHHLPLKRAATPDEIAGVAYFLAGKDASYITGQVITVDGGLTITF
ncbi:SDR family NAD(P)-dependent oxidoreductase [Flavihumibacter fluvii]|uniref:SDR family NAD(P)-dependent oxidoreductase n=1 Tax=Flavihumibacter fluvii TaxID=2838157 RepID=UPI001BDEAFA3|nr:SDR family oxidoreductase [Flavihumibacter fluvii]ULQ52442.1 SDR family oxidoreductase [Flavihumibacter fluvii]